MTMTKDEIRALLEQVALTSEQGAKMDAQCLAEDAVEQQVNDALVDQATYDAQQDIIERMGQNPELADGQQQYVDIFVKEFEAEFRKLYAAAYANAYRQGYRKHSNEKQELKVV